MTQHDASAFSTVSSDILVTDYRTTTRAQDRTRIVFLIAVVCNPGPLRESVRLACHRRFLLVMKTLAAQIHRELERGERCTIYEFELINSWPLNEKGSRVEDRSVCGRKRSLSPILPHGMVRRLRQAALKVAAARFSESR